VWRRGSGPVLPPVRVLLVVSWAMSARVDPPEDVPRNPPFWIRDPPIKSSLHRLGLPGSLDTWGVDSGAIYTRPSDWPSPPSPPTTRRYRWDIDTFSPDPFWIPRGIDEPPPHGKLTARRLVTCGSSHVLAISRAKHVRKRAFAARNGPSIAIRVDPERVEGCMQPWPCPVCA